ncbi:hypothetical protein LTR94_034334, partial [Friedmanniomyces endolithicus]
LGRGRLPHRAGVFGRCSGSGGRCGRTYPECARHRRLRYTRRGARTLRLPGGAHQEAPSSRNLLGPLPRRPGHGGRQLPRRGPGRGPSDRGRHQRDRRAGGQLLHRRGHHGPEGPRGPLWGDDRRRQPPS